MKQNLSSDEILEILRKNKSQIHNEFNTIDIGLFGSYAENSQKERSDIDILVSFKKGNKDLFNFINLKLYFEDLFGREVDLVNKDGIKPALRSTILKQVRYV